MIGPASNFFSTFIIVTPVSVSPVSIDLCTGAAPLHFGSNEA